MNGTLGRIMIAVLWGGLAGSIFGAIGGYIAGLVRGGMYISLLTPVYVSDAMVAFFSALSMYAVGLILGILVGLVTAAINRPRLTWLLGALMGVLAAIVFRCGLSNTLVLAAAGLIAAVIAGWRMSPKRTVVK